MLIEIVAIVAIACLLLFLAQRLPLQAPIPLIVEVIIVVVAVIWLATMVGLGHRLG